MHILLPKLFFEGMDAFPPTGVVITLAPSSVSPCSKDLDEHCQRSQDAILLCKQFLSSTRLSQQPLLLLPNKNLSLLQSGAPVVHLPTRPFNEKTLHEFRKTASLIQEPPMDLLEGANYLRTLCDQQEHGTHLSPPELHIYQLRGDPFQRGNFADEDELADAWVDFAPNTPKRVTVEASRPSFPAENNGQSIPLPVDSDEEMVGDLLQIPPRLHPTAAKSRPAKKAKAAPKPKARPAAIRLVGDNLRVWTSRLGVQSAAGPTAALRVIVTDSETVRLELFMFVILEGFYKQRV